MEKKTLKNKRNNSSLGFPLYSFHFTIFPIEKESSLETNRKLKKHKKEFLTEENLKNRRATCQVCYSQFSNCSRGEIKGKISQK